MTIDIILLASMIGAISTVELTRYKRVLFLNLAKAHYQNGNLSIKFTLVALLLGNASAESGMCFMYVMFICVVSCLYALL